MAKKKCYIYTRVSTAAQIEGYSLEAQQEKLHQYAEYKGLKIVGEYCDAGKSGKSIKGRPSFMKMLDDISSEKDDISYVLVFKLSRFGRNAADILKSLQLLTDYDVDLVCVEGFISKKHNGLINVVEEYGILENPVKVDKINGFARRQGVCYTTTTPFLKEP